MKLCAITDEISQDFEHALNVMREYGVAAAELRGLWGTNIADLDAAQVQRAKTALQAHGMSVACLATPFFKCELETDEASIHGRMHLAKARGLNEQLELLRRCCRLAHEFDTSLIRVFTFWKRQGLTPEIEQQIVEHFAEPAEIAAQEGVTLVLENESSCYIGTGAETARVLAAIHSPNVRGCWDPGNAFDAGEQAYPDGYEAIRPYMAHVHVKDCVLAANSESEKAKWCVIGEGEIGYVGQFDALRRDGYAGYVSLETHYVPAGGTPEDGSRACLAALRKFVKD